MTKHEAVGVRSLNPPSGMWLQCSGVGCSSVKAAVRVDRLNAEHAEFSLAAALSCMLEVLSVHQRAAICQVQPVESPHSCQA